jgi:hypothetical protein
MRIKSKFQDYYDGVQAMGGYDGDDILYMRHPQDFEFKDKPCPGLARNWPFRGGYNRSPFQGGITTKILAFGYCGRIIPIALLEKEKPARNCSHSGKLLEAQYHKAHCYTIEHIDQFVAQHGEWADPAKWQRRGWVPPRERLVQWFEEAPREHSDFFMAERVPLSLRSDARRIQNLPRHHALHGKRARVPKPAHG